jgi:hypothetical protein
MVFCSGEAALETDALSTMSFVYVRLLALKKTETP